MDDIARRLYTEYQRIRGQYGLLILVVFIGIVCVLMPLALYADINWGMAKDKEQEIWSFDMIMIFAYGCAFLVVGLTWIALNKLKTRLIYSRIAAEPEDVADAFYEMKELDQKLRKKPLRQLILHPAKSFMGHFES